VKTWTIYSNGLKRKGKQKGNKLSIFIALTQFQNLASLIIRYHYIYRLKKCTSMTKKKLLPLFISALFLISCSTDDSPKLSSENKIVSFSISPHNETYVGDINNNLKEINIKTTGLELVNSIVPTIVISENATISPDADVAHNFNQEVTYTVTAESGERSIYKVKSENVPFSSEKKILRFDFDIDNETYEGTIDHDQLIIIIETYKDISSLTPIIEVSEKASISPNAQESQDFTDDFQYSVTAENGTSNTYTVKAIRPRLYASVRKCYVRATSGASITNYDLTKGSLQLYLENGSNSYLLDYFDLLVRENGGTLVTDFNFEFDENIVTADDYKLRIKNGNEIIAENDFTFDVLAEGAPEITSVNKTEFVYGESLIMTGTNFYPSFRYPYNGSIFVHDIWSRYLTMNTEATELQLLWTYSRSQFGSSTPTRVSIYHDGRYADSVAVILK